MAGVFWHKSSSHQPKAVAGLQVQTSSQGVVIPIAYGQARLAGNLIWYADFIPLKHTTSQGKKAGDTTEFSYEAAIAVGVCEGPIRGIANAWADKDKHYFADLVTEGFTLFLGSTTQNPWSYVTTNHPTEALAYRLTAYVAMATWPLTAEGTLQNWSWEVQGFLPFGGPDNVIDSNPADVITDYLTHPDHGAGIPAALLADLSQFSDYCAAAGLFISPAFDTQRAAMDSITDLLQGANSAIVWSGGLVKIVPYGDESLTANGVTFTPDNTIRADLTDDDFVVSTPGEDPIKIKRSSPADAYNQVQVECESSKAFFKGSFRRSYAPSIEEAKDQASIELYGLRPMPVVKLPWIKEGDIARTVAQLILHRVLYVRNTYSFKLGFRHGLLEPMDLVTITDLQLGLNQTVVRITEIEDAFNGELSIVAEDWPVGSSSSLLGQYSTQESLSSFDGATNVEPGDTA